MIAVLIPGMDKPKDCTERPVCDEYDECMLQPVSHNTWSEQWAKCPMVSVRSYKDYLNYIELMEARHEK